MVDYSKQLEHTFSIATYYRYMIARAGMKLLVLLELLFNVPCFSPWYFGCCEQPIEAMGR